MMGGFPIPSDIKAAKNFLDAMDKLIQKGNVISIYPEAHVWPYYTKIRDFVSTSFKYPVKMNKPSFCVTNTYQKNGEKVQMVSYVDGPFYPNKNINAKLAQEKLRDEIYNKMIERAKMSNIEVIKYIKKENS